MVLGGCEGPACILWAALGSVAGFVGYWMVLIVVKTIAAFVRQRTQARRHIQRRGLADATELIADPSKNTDSAPDTDKKPLEGDPTVEVPCSWPLSKNTGEEG